MVGRHLFPYDLSIVAILKNEGSYLKEWLDYHLLAGVDHFYLYDNESSDDQAEVVKPYIEAGLVDYIPFPGKAMQYAAYNDAVKNFKFQSRYMAFIDADEFIYPKINKVNGEGYSIVEIIDDILSRDPNAAGLAINWQLFGSNGQETADYSRGVLERFTRRAKTDWSDQCPQGYLAGNIHVKVIANPRMISFINNPHFVNYCEGFFSVNENGGIVQTHDNIPVTASKIVLNHYYTKSLEEWRIKQNRGRSDVNVTYTNNWYDFYNRNEEFDDGILKYRATRAENFSLESNEQRLKRVIDVLPKTLSTYASGQLFSLRTAMICRALSNYLQEKCPNDISLWKIYEETSLAAIIKSSYTINLNVSLVSSQFLIQNVANVRLLINELPTLLSLPYPIVKELRTACLNILPQLIEIMRQFCMMDHYVRYNHVYEILKLGADNFVEGKRLTVDS